MKGPLSNTVDRLSYLAFRAFAGGIRLLSIEAAGSLGGSIGTGFSLLSGRYRDLVRGNLSRAFPEKSEADIREIAKKHFHALGRNMFLSIRLSKATKEEIDKLLVYDEAGLKNLEKALAGKRGAIVAIPHLSVWELYTKVSPPRQDFRLGTIYQRLHNRYLDEYVCRSRSMEGTAIFDRAAGLAGPVDFVKKGGALGVLFDQSPGGRGVLAPFFNQLVPTSTLPGLLSQKTGAPVFYVELLPGERGKWVLSIGEPIFPAAERDPDFPASLAAELNRQLEETLRKKPEEWFWVHRRFKVPGDKVVISGTSMKHWPKNGEALAKVEPFRFLIRSPNPLGDACMALPAVRAIKRGRPDAHVTVCCRENLAPMWEAQAEIDAVIAFPKGINPSKVGAMIRESGVNFDCGILLPNSFRSALELKFAGVPMLVGYDRYQRKKLLKVAVTEPEPSDEKKHHVHRYLHLAGKIGADLRDHDKLLKIPPAPTPIPEDPSEIHIGVCPGAEYGNAKRYPIERYAEAIESLRARREGITFRISIFGSPNERGIGDELAGLLSGPKSNRAGETSISGLVDELRTCHFVATNDTGTMHLSAALGVPTVAIFGSTEPEFTAPIGDVHRVIRHKVDCSPCFLRECPLDYRCMLRIEPDLVSKEMESLLDTAANTE